jgi:membrane carboxypeptidase/penicillin-binding protein
VYGADIPAPIWRETMEQALRGIPEHGFTPPDRAFYRKGSGEEEEDKDKDKDKEKERKKADGAETHDWDWLFPP